MIGEMFSIDSVARKPARGKITCTTCKLKGCVGRCQWKIVGKPHPPKAAA